MKTCWLVSIALLFVFFSCSKNGSSPKESTNTIVATINGKTETFNNILIAKNGSVGSGAYEMTVSGASGTTATSHIFSLMLSGTAPITVGEYQLLTSGSDVEPSIGYQNLAATSVYTEDFTTNKSITITVTSVTGTNITGTFSGELKLFGTVDNTKTITNGTFDVNFK